MHVHIICTPYTHKHTCKHKSIAPFDHLLHLLQSKASGSPVIVVGTHIDQLQRGHATPDELKTAFYEMYHNRTDRHHRTYAGLQQTELRLLNTFETAQVQALRDYVYSFVLSYNLPTTGVCVCVCVCVCYTGVLYWCVCACMHVCVLCRILPA